MAGGLGFEPRFSESESDVLPLDDPPTVRVSERLRARWGRSWGRFPVRRVSTPRFYLGFVRPERLPEARTALGPLTFVLVIIPGFVRTNTLVHRGARP
jgi:hypothetical protein